jgi:hypothetical protein
MQIAADELTPGISAREYAARRSTLAASLPVGGMAVLGAATTVYMTGVIPFPYRQHADFLYLTGLTQVHSPAPCSRPPPFATWVWKAATSKADPRQPQDWISKCL